MDLLYKEVTFKIRGACFGVYNTLGGGIKENIICRALNIEFKRVGLDVITQARIDIFYRDEKIGIYIPDFIVNNKVIVEVKSKPFITKEDEKQFWSYLKGSAYPLGILVNFSPNKLTLKRYIYTK